MRRVFYLFSLTALISLSAACSFRILGVPAEDVPVDGSISADGGNDLNNLTGEDGGPLLDLTMQPDGDEPDLPEADGFIGEPDLAVPDDMEIPVDDLLPGADFTGTPLDLTVPPPVPDLTAPPIDMTPPIVPSHVGASYWHFGAAAIGSITEIDTMNLTIRIDGGAPMFPPTGVTLVIDPPTGLAVLSTGAFTVDKALTIIGNRGLVVVASGAITVAAAISAEGKASVAGPGGISGGVGAGGDGSQGCTNRESGGGGAGHLTDGALGGSSQIAGTCPGPGAAGKAYGPLLSDFLGGSQGGTGGRRSDDCSTSTGGGGGGAVQLTSSVSLTIASSGSINVGGGGGGGGCDQPRKTAGGGGGSGGTLLLEAPTVTINGKIAANGGGGGSGGGDSGGGRVGQDGQLSTMPATGGAANGNSSGGGGAGAAGISFPQQPGNARNAGGGGGATGYIWYRTRGTNPVIGGGSVVSPNAFLDVSL